MRLTCPNCGARYEVDDNMIPAVGRDVQCSNCSTTWFQPGRRSAAVVTRKVATPTEQGAKVEEPAAAEAPAAKTATEKPAAPDPAPSPEAAPVAATAPAPDTPTDHGAKVRPERPKRRSLDPGVRDILRSEADREDRLRRGVPDPVETQEEMSLTQDRPPEEARARLRAGLEDAEDAFEAAATTGKRRRLLPDIEEINSTLRASSDRTSSESAPGDLIAMSAARRRRGVRIGFVVMLAIAAGGTWLYLNSGLVANTLPAAEPMLRGFVATIDGVRFWLDETARNLASAGGG